MSKVIQNVLRDVVGFRVNVERREIGHRSTVRAKFPNVPEIAQFAELQLEQTVTKPVDHPLCCDFGVVRGHRVVEVVFNHVPVGI